MEHKEIPVLLLTGYLGSGKTTLLNNILSNEKGIRFAVIVNDIGEVNIDAELIQKGGIVGQDDDLVALQNGCICCTLRTDLIKQIAELIDSHKFDYIVIEASGICEPEPIAQTICSMEQTLTPVKGKVDYPRLDCIITVTDALRMRDEFANGDALQKIHSEEDIENLILQQIEFCNIVLLNKISEISEVEASHLRKIINVINPGARIIECNYCDIPIDKIINTGLFNFSKVATSATWVKEIEREMTTEEEEEAHGHHHNKVDEHNHHHKHEDDHEHCDHELGICRHHHHHHHDEGEAEEYGIGTFLYYRRAPFNLEKFDRFIAKDWPQNIIRTKGVMYFSANPDMSLLFEQAGSQKSLKEAGYWFATAPEEELQQILEREPQLRRDWDEKIGDRMIKLVFIGRDIDRNALAARLDECLDR